jgi:hypothetical protein
MSSSLAFSEESPIEALYVLNQESTFQVAFGFNYVTIEENSQFHIDVYKDNNLVKEKNCEQTFDDISGLYGKITCPIEKQGDGQYTFEGIITNNNEKVSVVSIKASQYAEVSSSFTFEEVQDGTKITLTVEGVGEDMQILSRIPKEVIELLTPENQEELIFSEIPYEIIEADPLIAWNVEKIPTDIEYTIKKNISKKDRENFGVEIRESKQTHVLTYLIFLLMIVILIYMFKPAFKKK